MGHRENEQHGDITQNIDELHDRPKCCSWPPQIRRGAKDVDVDNLLVVESFKCEACLLIVENASEAHVRYHPQTQTDKRKQVDVRFVDPRMRDQSYSETKSVSEACKPSF